MNTVLKAIALSTIAILLAFNAPRMAEAAGGEKAHEHTEGEAAQEDHGNNEASHNDDGSEAGHDDHEDAPGHGDHAEAEAGHEDHGHDAHGHGDHEEEPEPAKGPNNGRLLVNGDTTLELAIFEDGVPPEYRAWVSRAGKPVAPSAATLTVQLTRLGNLKSTINFVPQNGFLRGTSEVTEPHSFAVEVNLTLGGKPISWKFDSFEGRTKIIAAAAKANGITTAVVGPAQIGETRSLFGQVSLDPDRTARVGARFAGLVQQVAVNTGDSVSKGQLLATVESNDSLRSFAVNAPIAGTVMARLTNVGDVTGSAPLFEISDTANVLIEIRAFGRDAQLLQPGAAVVVVDRITDTRSEATIARVLPKLDAATRATVAIARLSAPSASTLRPGTAVGVELGFAPKTAALAVDVRAIQRFRDWEVVFIQVGDVYEIRPLELGQRDSRFAEVLSGINAGDRYVVEQSFLVKADIEKSGASHDH